MDSNINLVLRLGYQDWYVCDEVAMLMVNPTWQCIEQRFYDSLNFKNTDDYHKHASPTIDVQVPSKSPLQTAENILGETDHDSTHTEARDAQDSATDKKSLEISPFYARVLQTSFLQV